MQPTRSHLPHHDPPRRGVSLRPLAALLPAAMLGLLLAGCGTAPLEIAGTYLDAFGGDHQITDTTWTSFGGTSVIHILRYDNDSNYLLGLNDNTLSYNPGKYARQDWTVADGKLYYCATVYEGADLAAAQAGQANATSPATGGCDVTHDFTWTELIAQ